MRCLFGAVSGVLRYKSLNTLGILTHGVITNANNPRTRAESVKKMATSRVLARLESCD